MSTDASMATRAEQHGQADANLRTSLCIAPLASCDDMLNEFEVGEIEATKSSFLPFSSLDSTHLGLLPSSEDLDCTVPSPLFNNEPLEFSMTSTLQPSQPSKLEDVVLGLHDSALDKTSSNTTESVLRVNMLADYIKTPLESESVVEHQPGKKRVQKPPTTAGITLDNLKAVFSLERPEAEKRLGLKRTTFSNLSRYYGISKWPFRTIRDARNRKKANERLLQNKALSKEKRRKLERQQVTLQGVINLMYTDPTQSKDSNTLAVLMSIVASREEHNSSALI